MRSGKPCVKKFEPLLESLPEGSNVAVVTLLGSLCPVTLAHVRAFVEARHILEPAAPFAGQLASSLAEQPEPKARAQVTRPPKATSLEDTSSQLKAMNAVFSAIRGRNSDLEDDESGTQTEDSQPKARDSGRVPPKLRAADLAEYKAKATGSGQTVQRPKRLERFEEVLGFISLNGDSHVTRKLAEKGQAAISYEHRRHLVNLAIDSYPWMHYEASEGGSLRDLEAAWPKLNFIHFCMNGADDMVKYGKCSWSSRSHRFIAMGRPGSTERLLEDMHDANVDPDDGYLILGPELEDVSSSLVRSALLKGDAVALEGLLDKRVAEWCIDHYSGH